MVTGSNCLFETLQIRVTHSAMLKVTTGRHWLCPIYPILRDCARIDGLSGSRIDVGRRETRSAPATHDVPTLTKIHSPEQLRPHMFTAIVANDHRRRNCEYN
jgi:hypothetical protein